MRMRAEARQIAYERLHAEARRLRAIALRKGAKYEDAARCYAASIAADNAYFKAFGVARSVNPRDQR